MMPALEEFPDYSGTLLPGHPHPEEGEILSSWIVRLARANSSKLHAFARQVLGAPDIWRYDVDKSASRRLVGILSEKTGRSEKEVRATTLRSYESLLYESHNAEGDTRWILPLGTYHRTRTRYGLLYCPLCLREGQTPYFRKRWRLMLSCVCTTHEARLRDRCPGCSAPVAFHRADFADQTKRSRRPITCCAECGADLRGAEPKSVERRLLLRFQKKLFSYLELPYVEVQEYGPVPSFLYFDVLYQLIKIIGLARRGKRLRSALEQRTGTEEPLEGAEPPDTKPGKGMERASLPWRRHAMHLLGWLMEDWPERFTEVSEGGTLTRSVALEHMRKTPFWYEDFCTRELSTPKYSPTETEVLEAHRYLKKKGRRFGPHATGSLLGLSGSSKVRRILKENGKW